MRGRHWVWLGLLILGGAGLLGYRAATHSLGITTGTSHNEAFYRFTASYTVDKTETVSMDVVVACDVEVTGYKSGGSSWRTNRTPTHYPIVTESRHVVLVQVPNACDWVMRDPTLSREIFPFVQFIESADNLHFGMGYLTEDAYASPLSRLTFRGAHLQAATRRQWKDWREDAARDFVPTVTIPEPWGYDERESQGKMTADGEPILATPCWAMARFEIPEKLRGWTKEFWPAARPKYWNPSSRTGVRKKISNQLQLDRAITYNGWPYIDYIIHSGGSSYARGLPPGRSGTSAPAAGMPYKRPVPEVYPQLRSNRYDQWSNGKVPGDKTVWQLDYRPEMRGFSYCYASGSPEGPEVYQIDLTSKPAVVLVGRESVDVDQSEKFGPIGLTDATYLIEEGAWMIFERNEHFFVDSNVSF